MGSWLNSNSIQFIFRGNMKTASRQLAVYSYRNIGISVCPQPKAARMRHDIGVKPKRK